MRNLLSVLLNIKSDFESLFFFNEFKELTGKARGRIIALSVILGLTFLALGYAIGGINYLQEKMDDPFTNWVNLEIKNSYRKKVPNIRSTLEEDTMKSKFLLNNIGGYRIEFCPTIHHKTGEEFNKRLRTIDLQEDLLKEILNKRKGNVVHGYSYNGEGEIDMDKCGIIIRESTLKSLGYDKVSEVSRIPIKIDPYVIYPEVVSVVKELPNLVDFVVSMHFYRLIFNPFEDTNFINVSSKNRLDLLVNNSIDKQAVEDDLMERLSEYNLLSVEFDSIQMLAGNTNLIPILYFSDYYRSEQYDTIYNEKIATTGDIKYSRYTRWECNVGDLSQDEDPYYLSFNFEKLDNVRDFKEYMAENYQVEISMDQVEQKENFALVSNLTSFIAIILFGFSILSIVFYVNSLLRTHLEKIKMNLGTLKAFGLSNRFLISSYLKIILTFIVISIVIAYAICSIWNGAEMVLFENNYFDVFNFKIVIAIFVIIVAALLTSQRTISKTLLKTPGDLIYNR